MAKIILVTPQVNTTAWQLAQALRAQQHDVILLTSYGESVADTQGIEFMAYFKSWSFLEGLRIIPGLFGLQAQILHLLLEEDKMNPAQAVLATFAKSHPHCVLTTSLLHIRKGLSRRNPVRYLVEESDIITCPTVATLGELRGLNIRPRRQGRGILPPVLRLQDQDPLAETEIPDAERQIAARVEGEKFVLLPFNESDFDPEADFFLRLRILAARQRVVLWGSYSQWPLRVRKQFARWMEKHGLADRWLVTGEISEALLRRLFAEAEALVLAGLPLTPVELTDYFLKAIHHNCTLILDSAQAGVHGTLWKNGQNCWILNGARLTSELNQLMGKNKLRVSESLPDQMAREQHWLDHPLNELNRLYNRALEQKA